jgi:hypothetical protein
VRICWYCDESNFTDSPFCSEGCEAAYEKGVNTMTENDNNMHGTCNWCNQKKNLVIALIDDTTDELIGVCADCDFEAQKMGGETVHVYRSGDLYFAERFQYGAFVERTICNSTCLEHAEAEACTLWPSATLIEKQRV